MGPVAISGVGGSSATSTAGEITTEWAGSTAPSDPEGVVRAAKVEAEAYAAQHHPSKPDEARMSNEENKSFGGALKDVLGLPQALPASSVRIRLDRTNLIEISRVP